MTTVRCARCESADLRMMPVDERDGWPVYCVTCGWVGRLSNEELA